MKLRALHRYDYNTRTLNPGDVFEAPAREGETIIAMGGAERAEDDAKVGPVPPPKKKGARKGGYLRRDQRAQD